MNSTRAARRVGLACVLVSAACHSSSYTQADLGGSTLVALPPNLAVGGSAKSTVSLTVRRSDGSAVTGADVAAHFDVPGCSVDTATVLLDGSGTASSTVGGCSVGAHTVAAAVHFAGQSVAANLVASINAFTPAADGSSIVPGTPLNFTVAAPLSYVGTVHFVSSDSAAALPGDIALTADDLGIAALVGSLVLATPGTQTVDAVDLASGKVLTHAAFTVAPDPSAAAAIGMQLAASDGTATVGVAGTPLTLTVRALDAHGAVLPGFTGTMAVTATDAAAALPAPYTFTASDAGVHAFTGLVLRTAGVQTVTVALPGGASATTRQAVTAAPLNGFKLTLGASGAVAAGTNVALTVIAADAFGNQVPSTPGSVALSVSDPSAVGPSTLTVNADGSVNAASVTLQTAGDQTLQVLDTPHQLSSNVARVSVTAGAATALALNMLGAAVTAVPVPTAAVAAVDAYGNTVPGYVGSVTLSSDDPGALFPATASIAAGQQGSVRLDGLITLARIGPTVLTATDATGLLSVAHKNVYVAASAPTAANSSLTASGTPVASGYATATITLVLRDTTNAPAPSQAVSFSASGTGNTLVPSSGQTDATGTLTTLLSSTVAETKTVTATSGALTMTVPVTFVAGPPVTAGSTLTASPTLLTADGVTQAALTLTARDAQGNLAAGQAVTLASTGGRNVLTPAGPNTDASGRLTATLTSTVAETKHVTAALSNGSVAVDLTFAPGPLSATLSRLVVGTQTRLADGASPTAVTATLRDGFGNLLSGSGIALSIDGPHSTWAPSSSGSTGPGGTFVANVTTTDVGTQTITAQAGGVRLTAPVEFLATNCQATPRLPGPPWPALGSASSLAVLADINADGRLDAAWSGGASGALSVALGQGNGTFATRQDYARSGVVTALSAADFDGDGATDLVLTTAAGALEIWYGNTNGHVAQTVSATIGTGPVALAGGDVTGDGRADVIYLAQGSNVVGYLPATGSRTFASTPVTATTQHTPVTGLLVRDINADGRLDVLVSGPDSTTPGAGSLAILLGQGGGTLAAATYVPSGAATPAALLGGDVDLDGNQDVIVAHAGSPGGLYLLRGHGDGTFAAAASVLGGNYVSAALRDFTGDATLDLLVHNVDGTTMQVLQGHGDGTFTVASSYLVNAAQALLVAGDLDGDGRPDAISPDPSRQLLGIWIDQADGTLLTASPQASGGTDVAALVVRDLDGDSRPDLLIANSGATAQLSFRASNGDGTFAAPVQVAAITGLAGVAVADLNADGKLDAVTANGSDASFSVLLGNGDGTFAAPARVAAAGTVPTTVALGDVTSDGVPDVVLAGGTPGGVSVLPGNGDGTFASAALLATDGGAQSPAILDLNGDGRMDIAVLGTAANNLSVLLATPGGSFATAVRYALGTTPTSLRATDLDNDGNRDLVVAEAGTNSIGVLRGRGDGTLIAEVRYPAIAAPGLAAVADMNNDGFPDVIVASTTTSGIALLYSAGDATLSAPTQYPTQLPLAVGVYAADLTRRGRNDLVVIGAGTVGLDVALNRSCGP